MQPETEQGRGTAGKNAIRERENRQVREGRLEKKRRIKRERAREIQVRERERGRKQERYR